MISISVTLIAELKDNNLPSGCLKNLLGGCESLQVLPRQTTFPKVDFHTIVPMALDVAKLNGSLKSS
jgi:hypothetical protein